MAFGLEFEWDQRKARHNIKKHQVSFPEATTVFADPLGITISDPVHAKTEDRWVTMGESVRGRLLVVAFVERRGKIRIISARRATRRERSEYEEIH